MQNLSDPGLSYHLTQATYIQQDDSIEDCTMILRCSLCVQYNTAMRNIKGVMDWPFAINHGIVVSLRSAVMPWVQ